MNHNYPLRNVNVYLKTVKRIKMNEQSSEAVRKESFHFDFIYNTWNEGLFVTYRTDSWMGSVALVLINYNLFLLTEELPSIITDLTPHLSMTDRHMSPLILLLTPPTSIPPPCWVPQSESRSLPLSLPLLLCLAPLPWMLLQDQKKNYKAVQSCEEGGSGGAYLEPLVALAQNGANMHNVLGPACIFLRKGFAESRQAVRKSRQSHAHACQEISTQ